MAIRRYNPTNPTPTTNETPRIRRQSQGGAHFQLTQVNDRNREYGASRDFYLKEELPGFLQALAESGAGVTVPSLASTGVDYMAFDYAFIDDSTLRVDVPIGSGPVPALALPFLNDGVIQVVFSEVPADIIRAFA